MQDIHESTKISPLADIEKSVKGTKIIIGKHCMIDSFVKIKPAGGTGDLVMGDQCYINSGCVLYTGNGITMGDKVLVAANCTFAPVNHAFKLRNKAILDQGFLPSKGGIKIEDDVWLGAGVVVLDGAYIKRGCVVAANAVVRGELEPYGVYAGNPAVKISERTEGEALHEA